MSAPATFSICCPSCGNEFLAQATMHASLVTCPYCAYNAPLNTFAAGGVRALPPAPADSPRRRFGQHAPPPSAPYAQNTAVPAQPQYHSPFQQVSPKAHYPGHPAYPPAPDPRQYPPSYAQGPYPPVYQAPPAPADQQTPVYSAQPPAYGAAFPPPAPPFWVRQPAAAPVQQPRPAPARNYTPQVVATLMPHPAADAEQLPPPLPVLLSRRRAMRRNLLMAASLVAVMGSAIWLVWSNREERRRNREIDIARASAATPGFNAAAGGVRPGLNPGEELRAAQPAGIPTEDEMMLQQAELSVLASAGPRLLRELLAGDESETANLLEGAELYAARAGAFREKHPALQILAVNLLPVFPLRLVDGKPLPLFSVFTSACPDGALAYFTRDQKGDLRMNWPLFEETHEGLLHDFARGSTEEKTRWFNVGIRKAHGLELDAETRERHLVFDIQCSAGARFGWPAVADKNSSAGLFLDQKTVWQSSYLARLLLQAKTMPDGTGVLLVIDCDTTTRAPH
jgi:hypothetical protein